MAERDVSQQARPHQPIIPQTAPGLRIARHRDEVSVAIARVVASGRYILGTECDAFEEEFARFVGAPFVIGVNSGTDALSLALLAVGVRPGHEVIVPALTAAATAVAVRRIGASARFIDVEPAARGIAPALLAGAISSRTAAVIVVHLHGMPALLSEIVRIAGAHGLPVVEDCAHAHGASIEGRFAGTLSDAAAFSFYPSKNLGALGDGGAVVVRDRDAAERLRRFRNYGQTPDGVCAHDGMNTRLDEIQAAVLRVLLHHLPADNAQRRIHARRYGELLAPLVERGRVALPTPDTGAVYHQYAVEVSGRDRVRAILSKHGVETGVHYSLGLHRHPGLNDRPMQFECPVTDRLSDTLMSLPIQPELMEHQPRIVEALFTALADSETGPR